MSGGWRWLGVRCDWAESHGLVVVTHGGDEGESWSPPGPSWRPGAVPRVLWRFGHAQAREIRRVWPWHANESCDWSCADGRNRAAMAAKSTGLGPETRERWAEATVRVKARCVSRWRSRLAAFMEAWNAAEGLHRIVLGLREVRESVEHVSSAFRRQKVSLSSKVFRESFKNSGKNIPTAFGTCWVSGFWKASSKVSGILSCAAWTKAEPSFLCRLLLL